MPTVAEVLANPPDLDTLLERVQAGDVEAVELVKALFEYQKNNEQIARWLRKHEREVDRLAHAAKVRLAEIERIKKASAGRSKKSQAIKQELLRRAQERWPRHSNNQVAHLICYRHPDLWAEIVKAAGHPTEKLWSASTIERALGQQKKKSR